MANSNAAEPMLWAFSVLTLLATLVVVLRILCKRRRGRPIRWDDYTLIAAWFFLVVSFTLIAIAVSLGYGRHLADLETGPAPALRLVAACEFSAVSSSALGKTSIAITLLQVVRDSWQRRVVWGLAVSVNAVMIGFAIFLWVVIWDHQVTVVCNAEGRTRGFVFLGPAWSVITDFAFAILPWFFIWHLHMQVAERIGLGAAMSFGILSGVTAIIKIGHMRCEHFEHDITYDSVPLVVWTYAQPVAIIVAASVPVLRHFIHKAPRPILHGALLARRGNSGVAPTHSFSPSADLRRHSRSWCITGGPLDTSIPLQSMNGQSRAIMRTVEVLVGAEAPAQSATREPVQAESRSRFQSPTSRLSR